MNETAASIPSGASSTRRTTPGVWLYALAITAAYSFGAAGPIFDQLRNHAVYIADLRTPPSVLVLLALVVGFAVPLACTGTLLIVHFLRPQLMRWVGGPMWIVSSMLFPLLLLNSHPTFKLPTIVSVGLAMACAVLLWVAWQRVREVRWLYAAASTAAIMFPAWWIATPPVSRFLVRTHVKAAIRKPRTVVMIVFDEFCGATLTDGKGNINAACFPNFSRLADEGTWFRNATTNHWETVAAVPSLLTGRLSPDGARPTDRDHPVNLLTIALSSPVMETAVFEPVTRLFPVEAESLGRTNKSNGDLFANLLSQAARAWSASLIPNDDLLFLPRPDKEWYGLRSGYEVDVDGEQLRGCFRYHWAEQRDVQFDHFLRTIQPGERPTLHFMHILIPHVPWMYFSNGERYSRDRVNWSELGVGNPVDDGVSWSDDGAAVMQGAQQYFVQLGYGDKLIGRLIDRLKETGLYDDCLLVITADHGVSFRPGDYRRKPTETNLEDILSIPMFIKRPGQTRGEVRSDNVESIDVFPTIAAELSIEHSEVMDGTSLFDPQRTDRGLKRLRSADPEMTRPADYSARIDILPHIRTAFRNDFSQAGLFALGPKPDWHGRAVSEWKEIPRSNLVVKMSRKQTVRTARRGEVQPGCLHGRMEGRPATAPQVHLAVAVNGVIRASMSTFTAERARDEFMCLVPQDAFQEGENNVCIYEIDGESLRLCWCSTTDN